MSDNSSSRAFCMAGKVGMEAYGFTCFFNSAIQALAHVEPISLLSRGLPLNYGQRNGIKTIDENEKFMRTEFAYLFQRVVRELWVNKRSVVNPSYLLRSLNRSWNVFDEDELDVHDVFLCILESLHRALAICSPDWSEPRYKVNPYWLPAGIDRAMVNGTLITRKKTNHDRKNSPRSPSNRRTSDDEIDDYHGNDDGAVQDNGVAGDDQSSLPEITILSRKDSAMTAMGNDLINDVDYENADNYVKSMVTDTLQGITCCCVTCHSCGSSTYSCEPFFSIVLDFPETLQRLGSLSKQGSRRISTIVQRKDGSEDIEMLSIGDMLQAKSVRNDNQVGIGSNDTYDNDGSSNSIMSSVKESASSKNNDNKIEDNENNSSSVSTPVKPLQNGFDKGATPIVNKSIRLHRQTSARVWCRRGNGMDSIRVPIPFDNPYRAIRINDRENMMQRQSSFSTMISAVKTIPKQIGNLSPQKIWNHKSKFSKVSPDSEVLLLSDFIRTHFRKSIIPTERFSCSSTKCQGKSSTASKHTGIANFPEVMVFSIRRGTFCPSTTPPSGDLLYKHNDAHINFPLENLEIAQYLIHSPWYNSNYASTGAPLYDLQSIIVYETKPGQAQGKHVNYSRHYDRQEQGAWYAYSDAQVKEVTDDFIRGLKPVLLFYVKQVPLGPVYRAHKLANDLVKQQISLSSKLPIMKNGRSTIRKVSSNIVQNFGYQRLESMKKHMLNESGRALSLSR
jgi:ubiquitin C-terminal hydrolase